MNETNKGYQLREQIKKINQNVYKDLLDYSESELRKNPKNTFMLIAKSYALNEENQYQQAIQQCEIVLKEQPQNLHAIYRKAVFLNNLKQHKQAIKCLDQALKINPKYLMAYNKKAGILLQGLQKYKDAITCYDKAIKLNPSFAIAYRNKCDFLSCLKNYNQAIEVYEQAYKNCKSCSNEFKNLIIQIIKTKLIIKYNLIIILLYRYFLLQ